MSDAAPDEIRLAAEIERLKVEFPQTSQTRELYREACVLLFFRFGMTPTANRLHQLVRRGSMSTPVAVLAEFWSDLREKSRVRIEHADLPEDLQGAASVRARSACSVATEASAARRTASTSSRKAASDVSAADAARFHHAATSSPAAPCRSPGRSACPIRQRPFSRRSDQNSASTAKGGLMTADT
ncbi:DNA-binding protein, partial [Burkholderia cenocepacia]|uniref:DNA-binding protein n=1 Tax=Burkholderia cenocepacia TaxID=95486 RepID=UPI003BFA6F56